MRPTTALIAEDETVLREELRAHLATLWPELEIAALAQNGIEALRLIERHQPDVAFLDIDMPGLTGLEVARQCEGRCHAVFVTAYDAYAVAAFEQGAIDYVLKPYDAARLASTVRRVRQRLDTAPVSLSSVLRELAAAAPQRQQLRWINASIGNEVKLIMVDEVCYFQSDTKYTRVVTADSEALIRRSLKELQEVLDPANFWPIHRSTIVNANAIAGVTRDFRGRVSIRLKSRSEKLPVSDANVHLFRQM
ncbi:LytR/AlgR family response regulator transcription factor [Variovorax sp. RT4R15]|uniref:LytR/AlgR family response regulator transcription factor n=1 Tax=Variovorax sp. RT4R15 TaxID=3443737 RepID=UPI003F4492B7